MRIRVPKEALVVAALVLAVVIPSSRPAFIWLHRISAKKQLNISDGLDHPESSTDPQVLLAEANRLYWLNNGPKAGPLYAKAESLFASRGDARNELYAKIGHLRSEAETMSFVDISRFLNNQLQNPIMRNDPRLRLWCLAAKGYTDIEIDYRAEKQDWLEAQQIAKSLGDYQWATRASGELGVIAFLEGDSGRAAKLLGGALVSTMANGDSGGQIRFLELLGNGMVEVNRNSEALMFFERAIKIAEAEKDSGLPFMAYEGKAQALVALGRPDEAKSVLQDALAKAQSQQKQGFAPMVRDEEIERIAVEEAKRHEIARGWVVESVEADNRGFDLISRKPHPHDEKTFTDVRFIEVKGRVAVGEVALTANEYKTADRLKKDYWLYVVFNCGAKPELHPVQDPGRLGWEPIVRIEHYHTSPEAILRAETQ